MAVYLVDYENVNSDLLADAAVLKPEDCILIFYSRQVNSISLDVLGTLQKGGTKVYYIKTFVGTSNALDFQLVTYLGYLIRGDKDQKYYIVSRDHGFRCIGDFWNSYGVSVQVIGQIGNGNGEAGKQASAAQKSGSGVKGGASSKNASGGRKGQAENASAGQASGEKTESGQKAAPKKKSLLPLFKKESEKKKHEKAQAGKKTEQQEKKPAEPTEKEILEETLKGFITDPARREETAATIASMRTRTQINDYLTKNFRGKQLQGINKAIKPLIRQRPGE